MTETLQVSSFVFLSDLPTWIKWIFWLVFISIIIAGYVYVYRLNHPVMESERKRIENKIQDNKAVIHEEEEPYDPRNILGIPWVLFFIGLIFLIVHMYIINYVLSIITSFTGFMSVQMKDLKHFDVQGFNEAIMGAVLNFKGAIFPPVFIEQQPNWAKWVFILLLLVGLGMISYRLYRLYDRYKRISYDQKGNARWTTVDELNDTYKLVPTKTFTYKGQSGFPISHNYGYFIDDATFNTLIIGTSRSGKGVTSVIPSMDIDSRAEIQPSIIVADPKGELAGASYETLRRRGYDVEILNISNPNDSMSYNPLHLITKYYERGDMDNATKYTKSLTHTLFHDPKVEDKTWINFASGMTQALILAVVDYCVKTNQKEKITFRNVYNMLIAYGTMEEDPDNPTKEVNKLDQYMQMLKAENPEHPAVIAYGTVEFAEGKTRSSIFTTVAGKLDDINKDSIAKMMSRHSVNFKRPGFNKSVRVQFTKEFSSKRGVLEIKDDEYPFKLDSTGAVEINFNTQLDKHDEIYFKFNSEEEIIVETTRKLKSNGLTYELDPYTNEYVYDDEVDLFFDTDSIEEIDMTYSDKPIAIFMVVPDYDSSEHFIASIFISQMYSELARECETVEGRSCFTRVKFRLDEFGNFPTIQDMAENLTVSLGRNILWELYVQELDQIKSKYNESETNTIISNCQNKVYIKSTTMNTAETMSKLAGTKTVINKNLSSDRFDTRVNESRSLEAEPLIRPDELLNFVMGETMVIRSLKSSDKSRKDIRPFPILNTGKTQMPRAFETIIEDFDTNKSLSRFSIPSKHRNLVLSDNAIDFKAMFNSNGGKIKASYLSSENQFSPAQISKVSELITQYYEIEENENIHKEIMDSPDKEAFYDNLQKNCPPNAFHLLETLKNEIKDVLENKEEAKETIKSDRVKKRFTPRERLEYYYEERLFKIKEVINEETFNQLFHIFNARIGTKGIDETILDQLFKNNINVKTIYEFLDEIDDQELTDRLVNELVKTTRK